ncbi:unnamed protein product [Lymnaea stagnalis]|uniref:Protein AATF n=1 Tax=Lymnaea stagnalis TaxID=6523 RepID=A0AAV2I2L7_LYMST
MIGLAQLCTLLLVHLAVRNLSVCAIKCYHCDNSQSSACGNAFKAYQFQAVTCASDGAQQYKCGKQEQPPDASFKATLVDDVDEAEDLGATSLRKQAAIISDDPRYKGKRTSRKDLYSDDEDEGHGTESGGEVDSQDSEGDQEDFDAEEEDEEEGSAGRESDMEEDEQDDSDDDSGREDDVKDDKEDDDATIMPETKSDDRGKGEAVVFQLGVWDDLIKSRIALQKMVTACNRLPQPVTWPDFLHDGTFRTEANNVHSSVRKLVSALLELQAHLTEKLDASKKVADQGGDSDEEITSESEPEDGDVSGRSKKNKNGGGDDDEEEDREDEDMEVSRETVPVRGKNKRKLNVEEVEETLSKRHKEFQPIRNDTLSKWDEKTRLAHGKIKSKNFAAFEMSVLKQIEQVLVNRERLVRRLHQQRSAYRILGQQDEESVKKSEVEDAVEDEDDDHNVEMKLKQRGKQELPLNREIIDDNDFYHVCLRDLIEMKQNEETDPVTASKQWLEIQRLRNKQKRKIDTRASKGRKIRYNVKEKLKNYMTPYDKSLWSDEQKDDLFKALFGGKSGQDSNQVEQLTINLGI